MEEKHELIWKAGISTEHMLEPDPINKILKEARKKVEKNIKKVKADDYNFMNHLRMYRLLTKLLNREPLSIFDMPTFEKSNVSQAKRRE